ncbi:MAG: glycosyltransferase family 2 protein [Chitinophagaceae bacterium]|nr:glycosyltransferase family 2 protein [Chitinophagaceae bacterium]
MIKHERRTGVSVILCCHNSEKRIEKTLQALAAQKFTSQVFWEIILVDNASSDNTAAIALMTWETLDPEAELRIIYESKPGLGNARLAGIDNAACEFVLFCDDDNWLCSIYIQGIFDILSGNERIAACGGEGIAELEIDEPFWFKEYHESYATGSQNITSENGKLFNLYGAGMGVKRKVLDELEGIAFKPLMSGRVGKKLSSSEDTELTYAFVLMGYELHYAQELKFFHDLPKERLTFKYLQRLFIAFGSDGPIRNLYYSFISERPLHKRIRNWSFHLLLALFRFVKYLIVPPKKYGRWIYFHWNIAYIKQLIFLRTRYREISQDIAKLKGNTDLISATAIPDRFTLTSDFPKRR